MSALSASSTSCTGARGTKRAQTAGYSHQWPAYRPLRPAPNPEGDCYRRIWCNDGRGNEDFLRAMSAFSGERVKTTGRICRPSEDSASITSWGKAAAGTGFVDRPPVNGSPPRMRPTPAVPADHPQTRSCRRCAGSRVNPAGKDCRGGHRQTPWSYPARRREADRLRFGSSRSGQKIIVAQASGVGPVNPNFTTYCNGWTY